jgi:UPF0755 protein
MIKKIGFVVLVLSFGLGIFSYQKYQAIFEPNVPKDLGNVYLFVPTGTDYEGIKKLLVENSFTIDVGSFEEVASLMKYDKKVIRSGRYEITAGWNNRELIQHLRSGKQASVNLVLNNERLIPEVAGKISSFIESDSLSMLQALQSPALIEKLGLSSETLMTIFIPNTYRVYWNTTPEKIIERLVSEKNKFWSSNQREEKREKLGLTKEEVYTLASIVEKETNYKPEKSTVAGVYLNRLRKDIALQADPTVVFANQDFTIRRVLNRHLEKDSPYNTYKYSGLPPGPIAMASISSIDAVLENKQHNYIYFCAKPDNSGQHAFARNLATHNANARKFQKWLNKQRIYR